jgi:ABC-2 type transport system ATP-binding protein
MFKLEKYHIAYRDDVVIDNLNLNIAPGTIHGIVGLNGAGKTTLLNGIYRPTKDNIENIMFNGAAFDRNHIAFLETQNFFYTNITAREYMALFIEQHPKFDLEGWNVLFKLPLDQLVETYSTGMKKKLALLGTLALDRPIMMLDEPSNGLDLESNRHIKQILEALRSHGKTIIITSHIFELLTALCDRISYLQNKHIEHTFERDEFDSIEKSIFKDDSQAIVDKLIDSGTA